MSIFTRQLTAAAVAAAAVGAGAVPALAASQRSSSTAVTARTPLVAAIAKQTDQIQVAYSISHNGVDTALYQAARASAGVGNEVERVHADSAQLPAKLEWLLGVRLEVSADNAIQYGEQKYVYKHPGGAAALRAGLTDYRLSNFYIAHADSQLGVPHRSRNAEPYQAYRDKPVPAGPGTLPTPTGLVATIRMATPVLQERLPDAIETTYVALNEAAAGYYSVAVARMHVDGAQRRAQVAWVKGVQTLLRGDELLGHGSETHTIGNPTTGNDEMKRALGVLRDASSEIARADASLGVRSSGPSVTIPAHVKYYKG